MSDFIDYRSLVAAEHQAWHTGSAVVLYDFITATPPSYYRADGGWDIGGTLLSSFANFAMDEREQAMMELALTGWDEVAAINLEKGGGLQADIVIGSADFRYGLYGFSYYPDADVLGRFGSLHGDIWINRGFDLQYAPGIGPIQGHTSWYTYLHEIGHALGLSHPNDRPNDPETHAQYTVMSYVDHPSQQAKSASAAAFPLTPMLWDIQAVQALYGANTETRATNTVYLGAGAGFDASAERAFQYGKNNMQILGEDGQLRDVILTLWDSGGTDLLDASDTAADAAIDLRPGRYSSIGGITENVAVAAKVRHDGHTINLIEQAWGGTGEDWISGNFTGNTLRGNAGTDHLLGRGGNDRLYGGDDADHLLGHRGRDRLYGGDGDDRLEGGQQRDWLRGGTGHDRLAGGSGHDHLWGHGGHDLLWGDNGNDYLHGGFGRDTLNGGSGDDLLFGGAGADVFVFVRGADQVLDFNILAGDQVDLTRAADVRDFDDLNSAHLHDHATGLQITDAQGHSLVLHGITLADITEDMFVF